MVVAECWRGGGGVKGSEDFLATEFQFYKTKCSVGGWWRWLPDTGSALNIAKLYT